MPNRVQGHTNSQEQHQNDEYGFERHLMETSPLQVRPSTGHPFQALRPSDCKRSSVEYGCRVDDDETNEGLKGV